MRSEVPRGWSKQSLEGIVSTITGGTSVNCEDRPKNGSEKAMLKLGAVSSGVFRPSEHKVASGDEAERLKVSVRRDTILFVRKNTPELVGRAAYVNDDYQDLFLPDLIWELRAKSGVSARWLGYWLESPSFQALIPSLAAGSSKSMVGINRDALLESLAIVPPLGEQERIAAVLGAWDEAIHRTENLIAAKRRRFRAILLRYSAEHHNSRREFGDLVSLISAKAQPGRADVPNVSVELEDIESGTGRLLGQQPVTCGSAPRNRFSAGDTLFGKLRPYLAKFARPDFDGLCSTEIWVLRARGGGLSPDLLPFVVQTPEFMAAATKQSGSRMPRADWEVVSAAPVPCPTTPELQSRAAERLGLAWSAAHADLAKLDRLRFQKRGLMQKLLTGECRLGTDSGGAA